MTDFLSYWNPLVHSIRERLPFAPLPTFSFPLWLGGLVFAVMVLAYLSRFAYRGVKWMKIVSYFVAVVMLFNGIQHLVASVYMQRAAPGVYSSPLLVAAAAYLLVSVRRYWRPPSSQRSGA
jgi:predicted tellurium resistance membrane protein TerC